MKTLIKFKIFLTFIVSFVNHRALCVTIFGAQRTQSFTRRSQRGRWFVTRFIRSYFRCQSSGNVCEDFPAL